MKLSCVVLSRNEEKSVENCLQSLSFCDEIVVIDDNSSDQTVDLAKKYGARVFNRLLQENFADQRNFGLEKARGEWVLFVDADERVSEGLANGIKYLTEKEKNDFSGFYIVRRDILWGRELKYGETGNTKLLRFAKKKSGKWIGKVHEIWSVSGKIGLLKYPIVHYPHQSIGGFLKDINFYTDLRVKELFIQGVKVHLAQIVIYPVGKFVMNYFLKLGFFDGVHGFILAGMMSFHSFLVRGKLWQLWQKK